MPHTQHLRHGPTTPAPRDSSTFRLVHQFLHELAQPLSAISNYAGACRANSEQLPDEPSRLVQHYAGMIASEALRAGQIGSLLSTLVWRLGSKGREPIDSILRETAQLVASTRRLPLEFSGSSGALIDDPAACQQLLLDLFDALAARCDALDVRLANANGYIHICIVMTPSSQDAMKPPFELSKLTATTRSNFASAGCRLWLVDDQEPRASNTSPTTPHPTLHLLVPTELGQAADNKPTDPATLVLSPALPSKVKVQDQARSGGRPEIPPLDDTK
ncbi:MAG: hypothetical protein KDB14_33935 [Planctomycetales bacterium]|nr:hypothetical protein [Planctomycetales bacterium]